MGAERYTPALASQVPFQEATDRTRTDPELVMDAIYRALARWDAAERNARDLRAITKADVRRVDRLKDGSRIPTPRRNALARYLTDAVLTALREAPDGR